MKIVALASDHTDVLRVCYYPVGCFQGTNEVLRMYIALTGMQHAGNVLTDKIKYRTPGNVFRYSCSFHLGLCRIVCNSLST